MKSRKNYNIGLSMEFMKLKDFSYIYCLTTANKDALPSIIFKQTESNLLNLDERKI